MKSSIIAIAFCCASFSVFASSDFTLASKDFTDNQFLPFKYGYCQPNEMGTVKISDDISPELMWKNPPAGTKSFALTVIDIDGATSPHFNQQGYTLTKHLKRAPFTHWVIANIPMHFKSLPEGAGSRQFVPGGKSPGKTPYGLQGINSYTYAFSSPFRDRITFKPYTINRVKGTYGRYDGPCAPWNDELVHQIVFTLYALNVKQLKGLPRNGKFTSQQLEKLLNGHVLGKAIITAKYATNALVLKNEKGNQ